MSKKIRKKCCNKYKKKGKYCKNCPLLVKKEKTEIKASK
jgi:hypothetical protein